MQDDRHIFSISYMSPKKFLLLFLSQLNRGIKVQNKLSCSIYLHAFTVKSDFSKKKLLKQPT